jgi:tight adherence protein B
MPDFGLEDAAELAGMLAALSRSGLPPVRIWQLLSEEMSAVAEPARRVAGMLALGGSAAAGLRIAAQVTPGSGARALGWLMITAQVVEHTGAPSAGVHDGLVQGIHAELEQAGELAVALAGPKATALVLSLLPLAGCGLGMLMGVNTLAVLLGSGPGRACLVTGAAFWIAGRRWIGHLLASVQATA